MESAQQSDVWAPSPIRRAFYAAIIAMIVGTVVATLTVVSIGPSGVNPVIFAALLVIAIVAARLEIGSGAIQLSASTLPMVLACVLMPAAAPLLGLTMLASSYPSNRGRFLTTGTTLTSLSAGALLGAMFSLESVGSVVAATAIVGLAFSTLDSLLVGAAIVWIGVSSIRNVAVELLASTIATAILLLPVATVLATCTVLLGPIVLPLLLVPLLLTQYFHGLYNRKVQLTDELADKAQVLARTNLQFAAAMVKALDARDAYTAGHSAAVAVYTRDIAREMGFDDETVRLAHLAGLLHDIGKIGVPGRVLNKTAPLDDEEYELMKSHAAMGAEILGEVDLYADIAILVRYHHERIDGKGYPDGIADEAIPSISRMISVADTYSAMTTDRPYRDGMPTEKAMGILRECRGTQLDSDFTDAFLRILIVADEAYQRGKQTEFEVEVAKHQALSEVEAEAVRVNAPSPVTTPQAPAATVVPTLPAAVDGELVEVDLEREAA